MTAGGRYVREVDRIFSLEADKRAAHERSRAVLADMAADPIVLSDALQRRLASADGLARGHYPVVSLEVATTPNVDIVLNCWLPLPTCETDVTTKAIHHHGTMLLTTVTAFGPGYEHWTFTPPELLDPERELFSMSVIEHGIHGLGHQAFVDANVAHVPLYVAELTITLAVWSSSAPTTWRDRAKRLGPLRRNAARLRQVGTRLGLAEALELKNIEYFDFFPGDDGFVGMRDREEFGRGPALDYFQSLCHIAQATGNAGLLGDVDQQLAQFGSDRAAARRILEQLRADELVAGVLSWGHHGVPHANFRRADIARALGLDVGR